MGWLPFRLTSAERWLLALADPADGARRFPGAPLAPSEFRRLIDLARRHWVLPTVLRSLQRTESRGELHRVCCGGLDVAEHRETLDSLRRTVHGLVARSTLLRFHAATVQSAFRAAGVLAAVIKGPAFADRLFDPPSLRCFNDIDLIVPRSEWEASRRSLRDLGFAPHPVLGTGDGTYGQEAWSRPNDPGVVIEVHWDLVNVPSMRRGVSVVWEDLFGRADPPSRTPQMPACALLLVAAVHAGAGHRFDRLGYLCDIVQCARSVAGPVDADRLHESCLCTGATLSVGAALRLAGDAFACDAAHDLAKHVSRVPGLVVAFPLSVRQVLRSQGSSRALTGIQRQLFRQRLKRSRARVSPVGVPLQGGIVQ